MTAWKECTRCGESRAPEEFRPQRRACRSCERAANPFLVKALNANWRARQLGVPGELTEASLRARVEMYAGKCWMCRAPWEEVDHLLPLARGGPNLPANVRPACSGCNKRKMLRTPAALKGVI